MGRVTESPEQRKRVDWDLWIRRLCALIVAGVAAFASFDHQRAFALRGGADALNAWLWPFSVDGLLVLATVALLKSDATTGRRGRTAAWLSFGLGVAVSLAANVAAAPALEWQPILVAGWPPVALLLAVELLAHRSRPREDSETAPAAIVCAERTEPDDESPGPWQAVDVADRGDDGETTTETSDESADAGSLDTVSAAVTTGEPTAQQVMWEYYQRERARGRVPTGAELDRVAGTNNYGRTVLRQWREQGRIPEADQRNGRPLATSAGRSGR